MNSDLPEPNLIFRKEMTDLNKIYVNYPNVYKKIDNDGYIDRLFSFTTEIINSELLFAFKSYLIRPQQNRRHQ